jgi:predicted NBD/HSP70 family sugar kinase
MKVLVIDVGGTHVKILVTGKSVKRQFDSGKKLTPGEMVKGVKELSRGWAFEAISIGVPAPVKKNRPAGDPFNLGVGWKGFDFAKAFGLPVKVMNDAAMQALGSYRGGTMLFLGLGTGLGTAMVAEGMVLPMELGHLPYRKKTFEDYLGMRGVERLGKKKWQKHVGIVVKKLQAALEPDYVVLGGGNVNRLKGLPKGCRRGENSNAFLGGFRLWEEPHHRGGAVTPGRVSRY